MKKRLLSLSLAVVMSLGLLAGCGNSSGGGGGKSASWKVTCPWAPSGVAAMVSQKAAAKSTEYSDTITLVAEAIAGDAATVNTWVMDTEANDPELVFVGEGLLSITSIIDPSKMQFTQDDFVFVENLYSSIFVLSADKELNINNISELEAFVGQGGEISVAVNGGGGPAEAGGLPVRRRGRPGGGQGRDPVRRLPPVPDPGDLSAGRRDHRVRL